jgi:transcription elongation GreA/GreB family factor
MNCPECGNPVEKDASFCPKCYARIEPPGWLRRVVDSFRSLLRPRIRIIKSDRSVIFTTTDTAGTRHEYRSPGEAPPEMLSRFKAEVQIVKSERPPTLITVDKDGNRHEYHSLDEVPPAMRSQFEKLQAEVREEQERLSAETLAEAAAQPGTIGKPHVSISRTYKIKDASGKEQTYHSLDELPPEIREKIKGLQGPFGGLS